MIKRGDLPQEFTRPHCGTSCEAIWQFPARVSEAAPCEECNQIKMKWSGSPIPFFGIKAGADRH
jgi:hypothetical protein